MTIPLWIWIATAILILALLLFDYIFHVRKAHVPSIREAAIWSAIYVGIALVFGVVVLIAGGAEMGIEYFSGYVLEKSLSVDNLFVFLIIMGSFKVPAADQQKVLLFGITFALIARTGFIFIGAGLLHQFAWMFYVFGVILLVTAGNMLRNTHDDDEGDSAIIRLLKRTFRTSQHYDGDKMFTVENGKRVLTPMLLVMIAIGATDLMFALDSIPAIFGVTQNTFIVFTATAFSLLGLRQLFFLVEGLLDRLVYLSYGLAVILGFIGVKLVLHALHENTVWFINDGQPVNVVEVPTMLSLVVIVVVLVITIVASLASRRGKAQTVIHRARSHAKHYLDLDYDQDVQHREHTFASLLDEMDQISALPDKYTEGEHLDQLQELFARARDEHEAAVRSGNGERRQSQ